MTLTDPLRELLGFIGAYLSIGVVALHYGVLRPALGAGHSDATRASLMETAGRRAAFLGFVGVILATALGIAGAAHFAAMRHVAFVDVLIAGEAEVAIRLVCYAVAIVGFGLVAVGLSSGWPLAGFGSIAAELVNLLSLRWPTLVNPVHVLAGSIWIGALFTLMTIAVPTVLRGPQSHEEKALTVADMVNAFSPMALTAVAVLLASGATTAVRHLKYVAALWTTSYGITLVIKLCFVALVLGLGAWNWRRVRPSLGTASAAARLKRSARFELLFAGIVLLITSVLVSLPSPRLPG